LKLNLDDYNSLTFTADINKLLVPTTPIYDQESGNSIVSGFNPDVGVATGMIQSFYDAPGVVNFNDDGTYTIEDGSILREELRELNIGGGVEYLFNDAFAFRTGFFNEHYSKGARQFITLGAGIKYTVFTVDLSYLISTRQQNPLGEYIALHAKVCSSLILLKTATKRIDRHAVSNRLWLRCPPVRSVVRSSGWAESN
jgi:hypothetical protein